MTHCYNAYNGMVSPNFGNFDSWIGVIGTILAFIIVFVISPTLRSFLKTNLKKKDEQEDDYKKFRDHFMEKVDKLEVERDETYKRMADENKRLSASIFDLERQIRERSVLIEDLERKVRTLQWLYLSEVCTSISDKVDDQVDVIVNGILESSDDHLAEEVQKQFKKIIEEVRQNFIVQQLDRDALRINKKSIVSDNESANTAIDHLQETLNDMDDEIRGKKKKIRPNLLSHLPDNTKE